MLPYIQRSSWAALYFIVFIILGIHVLLNIALASVYVSYGAQSKKLVNQKLKLRHEMLRKAFDLIDFNRNGFVNYSDWIELFKRLRPDLPEEVVGILYNAGNSIDSETHEATMDFQGNYYLYHHDLNFWCSIEYQVKECTPISFHL